MLGDTPMCNHLPALLEGREHAGMVRAHCACETCFFSERAKRWNCKPTTNKEKKRSIMKALFCGCAPARQALEFIWSSIIKIWTLRSSTDTYVYFCYTTQKVLFMHTLILNLSLYVCVVIDVNTFMQMKLKFTSLFLHWRRINKWTCRNSQSKGTLSKLVLYSRQPAGPHLFCNVLSLIGHLSGYFCFSWHWIVTFYL